MTKHAQDTKQRKPMANSGFRAASSPGAVTPKQTKETPKTFCISMGSKFCPRGHAPFLRAATPAHDLNYMYRGQARSARTSLRRGD